ncbi:MAG: hypothetical protein AAGK37_05415 [Pseudomonadota bacterium]
MSEFTNFFNHLAQAKRMAHLFSLSDQELAVRGLDREALKRHYIAGLGAQ